MFQIFIIVGWAVLVILLLYLWADVREISGLVKENKRELLRSTLNMRASERFPNLREEDPENEKQETQEKERQSRTASLSPSEEQVLDEVLAEFLG